MAAQDKPAKHAPDAREARLARALRANLRRRKAAAPSQDDRDAVPEQKPDRD